MASDVGFDADGWFKKQEERLVELLVEVYQLSMNTNLYWVLSDAIEQAFEILGVPPEPCGDCGKEISRLDYEGGQGLCGSCISKITAEMGEGT